MHDLHRCHRVRRATIPVSTHMKPKDKLVEYGSHFPVVEVDASFYAVQPAHNTSKWVNETPENFRFVVKAYQGMTGHQRSHFRL